MPFCVQQEEQLKSALKEAEGQVKLLTSRCTKATQELEMAQKWKDELDVLRPQAAAKDRLDAQIEKYKKKLETFDEMKATMKRLEGTNAELIARNLDLEREASKVAPLRSQLEDVRDSKIMSVSGTHHAHAYVVRNQCATGAVYGYVMVLVLVCRMCAFPSWNWHWHRRKARRMSTRPHCKRRPSEQPWSGSSPVWRL
jgi:hypothetical protein